jgi:sugar/nucleoside kinase (ribokinase family)
VISIIGDDGEGYELRQALKRLQVVDTSWVTDGEDRHTPTYTKPMLQLPGQPARELNRLDIKNRTLLPAESEEAVLHGLAEVWPQVGVLLVLDQVSEANCGVITERVRGRLAEMGEAEQAKVILADSRERIGMFRSQWLKPNQGECRRAVRGGDDEAVERCVVELARRGGRPVFCTCGERGILLSDPRTPDGKILSVPAYPVRGPLDIVGAGDSTSAGIACALAAGATLSQAAAFGNLVASITIQQIGTTGTATPQQVWQRWREIKGQEYR